jgi:predicted MFS family arabinose efflux permease
VNFDALGAALVTGGMLLLVFGLVRAPIEGWGSAQTIGVLAGAVVVLAAFVANERRQPAPLAPLSIFRINGLGFSNVTQLVAFAGFLALFFYVTLYMQNILGYSAVQTGLAYLPLCGIAVVGAGISSQLLGRVGTRPVIVVGAVIGAAGLYWLSRISVGGSYTTDLLPGLLLVGLGIAGLFVAVATAANAGVPADKAGLAAALLNASQWLGGALGLAIFTAVSTSRTNNLLAAGAPSAHALTSGFQRALLVGSIFILASAVIALRATNTRGETAEPVIEAEPEASLAA